MQLNPLHVSVPVVGDDNCPLQVLQLFSEGVSKLPILVGVGSPEGVVEAKQTRLYMDLTGVAGAILYVKQLDISGGNPKNGWILV